MMTRTKICGITNQDDAFRSVDYGAWALGFIFYKKSPRYISPTRAAKIIKELPPFVTPVGVFVNHKQRAVEDIIRFCHLNVFQLHGEEKPLLCQRLARRGKVIKAFRVAENFNVNLTCRYKTNAYLFDTYQENVMGGTGKIFNWHLLKEVNIERPYIISGGLTPENVLNAIDMLKPYAVDVSSGVERKPGEKDPKLLKKFLRKVNAHG